MQYQDIKAVPAAQRQASENCQRSRLGSQAPVAVYRPDDEISPEAVRVRQFLRAVLSIDYGIAVDGATTYPHDEYLHYAAVLYDRYNWGRVKKRHSHGTLASRALDLSASTTHLMLDRHVYRPALELGIQKDAIETILMRYLHFADPVARRYVSSIPGPRTDKASNKQLALCSTKEECEANFVQGIEALVAKVTTDRSVLMALYSDQSTLQPYERAITRVVLEFFPADHPMRREAEAAVQAEEKAVQEMSEMIATAAKSRRAADADLPEYVRWLKWFRRSV